jgi:hypothetical protein
MGASRQGDDKGRDRAPHEFYTEAGETSLALEVLACCKSGCTPKKIYSKAVRCYEIPLHALEKTEYAQDLARLANMHPRVVRACSLKIVDLLLFNTRNDPFLSLGLSRDANADEIHRRWKRLLVLFHPDRPAPGILNVTRTKMINVAYQSIRELLLEHSTVSPGVHSEAYRSRGRVSVKIISPTQQALDDVIKICVKYFWRSLYAINVLAGSVTNPKRLRRGKDQADYMMFIPSIIVLLTAFVALVMFSLYIIHSLFSLVGRIGFG